MTATAKTTVIFETATLADVLKKASRVAASRGAAFDKAAGIVFDIDPSAAIPVVVRATDLEIYQMEWVSVAEISGAPTRWRVHSDLISKVVNGLPLGAGQTVTIKEMAEEGKRFTHLQLTSKRVKSRINLMEHEFYPEWSAFDPDGLTEVKDLGARIRQVEWAAEKGGAPLGGIRIDGETLVCTDRYKLVIVPAEIEGLGDRIGIVPAGLLGQMLQKSGEVKVGFNAQGNMLIMPDEYTQIIAILYDADYPQVGRVMRDDYPATVTLAKSALIEMTNRALAFALGDRHPTATYFIGKGEIAVMVASAEMGHLGDVLETPGACAHERVIFKFTPGFLIDALSNAPNEQVTIHYDPTKPQGSILVDGGSGYRCWVMARREGATQ